MNSGNTSSNGSGSVTKPIKLDVLKYFKLPDPDGLREWMLSNAKADPEEILAAMRTFGEEVESI